MGNQTTKHKEEIIFHASHELPLDTPPIYHFYHLWVAGNEAKWIEVLNEHIDSLIMSGLLNHVKMCFVGFVGRASAIKKAQLILSKRNITYVSVVETLTGFEQVTLSQICKIVKDSDAYIVYCHNKGSYRCCKASDWWRQSMTLHIIHGWRKCIKYFALRDIDIVGTHWICAQEYPGLILENDTPFFGGNFWWAKISYLRSLDPLKTQTRFDAEKWIGTNPHVHFIDLKRGWPNYNTPTND